VRYRRQLLVIALLPFSSLAATAGTPSPHSIRALAVFVATSTSVHNSYSGSEDVFLAEAQIGKNTVPPVLVKLVDHYPPSRAPMSQLILTSAAGTWLHLKRDPRCDVSFSAMPLRAAPGDPIAIIPEPLVFQPRLPLPAPENLILPCYRVVR